LTFFATGSAAASTAGPAAAAVGSLVAAAGSAVTPTASSFKLIAVLEQRAGLCVLLN
jgi:hypothetical protein